MQPGVMSDHGVQRHRARLSVLMYLMRWVSLGDYRISTDNGHCMVFLACTDDVLSCPDQVQQRTW